MKTRRLATILAVAALVLPACKVDVSLGVSVDGDGSGEVRARFVLDSEAVEAVGGNLEDALRVADLIQVGWEVRVDDAGGGGAEVVAVKGFGSPEQFSAVVAELSGDAGPFRDFRLVRDRSFFSTRFEFAGTVDLGDGVGATALDPGDEGLVLELDEEDVEVSELQGFLTERLADVFSVEVVVGMPGDGPSNAPGGSGGEPRWEPEVGEVVALRAESSSFDLARVVLLTLGGLLVLLGAGVSTGRVALPRRVAAADSPGDEPGDEATDT